MNTKIIIASALLALATSPAFAGKIETLKTDIGEVVAASETGMTLYTFRKDAENSSNCYNDCAAAWPPFVAAEGAKASGDLGLTTRKDGTQQWTLSGQPLYFWAGDAKRGDVSGDGVGGVWDAARIAQSGAKKTGGTYKY